MITREDLEAVNAAAHKDEYKGDADMPRTRKALERILDRGTYAIELDPRLAELIDRVVGTSGSIAATLSASEWHELANELRDLKKRAVEASPFTLTEREPAAVAEARCENNPDLYPTSRSAILVMALERAQRTLVAAPPSAAMRGRESRTIEQLRASGVELIVAERMKDGVTQATYVAQTLLLDGMQLVPFTLTEQERESVEKLRRSGYYKFTVEAIDRAQQVVVAKLQPTPLTDAQVREIADAVGLGVGEVRAKLREAIERVLGVESSHVDAESNEQTLTAIADHLGYVNRDERSGAYERIDNDKLLVELMQALKQRPVHADAEHLIEEPMVVTDEQCAAVYQAVCDDVEDDPSEDAHRTRAALQQFAAPLRTRIAELEKRVDQLEADLARAAIVPEGMVVVPGLTAEESEQVAIAAAAWPDALRVTLSGAPLQALSSILARFAPAPEPVEAVSQSRINRLVLDALREVGGEAYAFSELERAIAAAKETL